MALSGRKKKWADLKIQSFGNLSNADAAIAAGYSADSASKNSHRFATDPEIIAYINEKTGGKAHVILVKRLHSKKSKMPNNLPQEQTAECTTPRDAKEFLEAVMVGEIHPTREQLQAAQTIIGYQHTKKGELGKKEQLSLFAAGTANGNHPFKLFTRKEA